MKNIITIARKELTAYFNNPTAYIVVAAFLLLWEFLFFRSAFLVGEVSLAGLFDYLPWIFMIVVPALTMGSLAEEKREGTLEFLLTHPLSQVELVIGKFLGIVIFLALALLFIFPLAWSFARFGNLDWGKVLAQYLASVSLAAVLASLGLFVSGFFSSQISAFLVSSVAGFFLIIAGTEFFSNHFPLELSAFLEQLSASTHFDSMSRGVIDARDVWYAVSLSAVFLGFAYLGLVGAKYGNRKAAYRNQQTAFVLLIGIVVLSNIAGTKIPGRIDLTEGNVYTLSPATREIAGGLSDIMNISLYASDQLPAQLQPTLRETRDTLEEYRAMSQGKIKVVQKNPSNDPALAKEAASRGIQPMRFNIVSQEEYQVKDGYLGIAISYGGKNEAIPFVQDVNDLEYQISSLIKKLTTDDKPKIGFVSGHGEKTLQGEYRLVGEELGKEFEVVDVPATGEDASTPDTKAAPPAKEDTAPVTPKKLSIPEGVKTLIIAGPTQEYSDDEKRTISDFITAGGNVLFLIEGVTASPQGMAAFANKNNLAGYLKDETGVEVKSDLVYDLRSNESVGFNNGQARYVLPYPFWVRAQRTPGASSPITSKLETVTLPWASSLVTDENALTGKGFEKADLFVTTEQAGSQTANFNIAPDQKLSQQDLGRKILALALSPKSDSGKGRIVIVGDADLLSDQNVQNTPANFGFGLEAISWLSQESSLSQIRVKDMANRKFVFADPSKPSLIKFGNLTFIFLVTAGYGSWRLLRRKRMKDRSYQD